MSRLENRIEKLERETNPDAEQVMVLCWARCPPDEIRHASGSAGQFSRDAEESEADFIERVERCARALKARSVCIWLST